MTNSLQAEEEVAHKHTQTQTTHTLTQAQHDMGIHSGIIQPIWKDGQKRGDMRRWGMREDVRGGQMERESGVGQGERKYREEEQEIGGGRGGLGVVTAWSHQ